MAAPTASCPKSRRPTPRQLLAVTVCFLLAGLVLVRMFLPGAPAVVEEPIVDLGKLQRIDGVLVWRDATNRAFTGWVTEQYGEARPKSRSHVVAGRLDGLSEGWHANGAPSIQEHFVAGLSEGLVTRWAQDGSKLSEGNSRAGRFEGVFRRWHSNGVLAEELEMAGGEPHGLSRSWHPSGSPKAEVRLNRGKVVERKFWPDGTSARLTAMSAGEGQP